MYSIVEREDTIRIPAEYIREGQSLVDHIDSLANDAFEGRFDVDENYTVLTFDHKPVGRGRIIHGDELSTRPSVSRPYCSTWRTMKL